MYAAKAKGKARVQVFEPGLLEVDSAKVVFERQLAAAVSNGELTVHYQPVLSLPDARCTAVEALVRWQHPERGVLYPDAFIETAERIDAIGQIGAYVLRRACADAAKWQKAQPETPLAVHVNLSGMQLDEEGFIASVTRCLSDFSLPPDLLVLEVTETMVISSQAAIDQLNILAAHGVRIAIDDFGTGYSALTTLRSLPAQMGMRTIAEGVETPEQQRYLETIGADAVQGFLYLRPTTAERFGAWLWAHDTSLPRTRHASDVVIPFTPRHTTEDPFPRPAVKTVAPSAWRG